MTRFLAALALACIASPAFAGVASEPVAWGAIAFFALMVVLGLGAVAVVIGVLTIIASGFNH